MMTKRLLPVAVTTALLAGAGTAQAEISANVTVATDYLFRGISQTDERPAIQGGFDYAHDSGIYVGTWASNVNFGTQTSTEMDYYIGFANETDGGFGYDLSVIFFDYPGDGKFDYIEYALGFSYGGFGFGLVYSDEYLGDDGPEFWYPYADYSFGLTEDLSLDLHVGYSDIDADDFWAPGEDSYFDYHIALGYSVAGVDLSLGYYDTDLDDDFELAEGRALFSISKSF